MHTKIYTDSSPLQAMFSLLSHLLKKFYQLNILTSTSITIFRLQWVSTSLRITSLTSPSIFSISLESSQLQWTKYALTQKSTITLIRYISLCTGYYNGYHTTRYQSIQYEFDFMILEYSYFFFLLNRFDNVLALQHFFSYSTCFLHVGPSTYSHIVPLDHSCKFNSRCSSYILFLHLEALDISFRVYCFLWIISSFLFSHLIVSISNIIMFWLWSFGNSLVIFDL